MLTDFLDSRCQFSRLSWSAAPMFSKSTKRRSSLASPLKNWRSFLRPHAPPVGTLSFEPFLGCARVFSSFLFSCLPERFCSASLALILVPVLRRGPVSLHPCRSSGSAPLRAKFLPPLWACVDFPFSFWPNIALGLNGFFFQILLIALTRPSIRHVPKRSVRRWKADILRTSNILVQKVASPTCRHLLAQGLRICTWSTRGFLGSAASSQRPRENKLKCLKRIAEKSDILCLQETHGRTEHLVNIDIVLDRATWMKFGTFTTWER